MVKYIYLTIMLIILVILCFESTLSDLFSKKYHENVQVEVVSSSMVVPVVIGGKTYHFILDTGASTSISKELFAELKLFINDSVLSVDLYGNTQKVYTAIIPELTIGQTRFGNFKLSVIRPIQDMVACGIKIDGCLGNDLLSKGVLQIDIVNKQISIANDIDSFDVENHHSCDFKTNHQMIPFLPVYFPGNEVTDEVMFDTGSGNYFYRLSKNKYNEMVKNNHFNTQDIIDTLDQSDNAAGAFGKQNDTENIHAYFDSITVVGVKIHNCPAYTLSSLQSSVLGAPFLRLGIVTIDYKNHRFYLKRYREKLVDFSPIHGITYSSNKKSQLVVESVLKGSIGEKHQIKKGYILQKLNATNWDSLSICERLNFNWSKEFDRDIIQYTFLTMNNEPFNVQIKKPVKDIN